MINMKIKRDGLVLGREDVDLKNAMKTFIDLKKEGGRG